MMKIQQKSADIYQKEQLTDLCRGCGEPRPGDDEGQSLPAELIRCYGDHALAFLGLEPENAHFLAPDGEGLVNYRLIGNVALVLGDPVCAPEACECVTRSFLDFCTLHHWHVAFYQARPMYLDTYRTLNLHAFKMGEEAMIDPQTFTLSGSVLANVRTSCRRAEREGVSIHWYEGVPPTEVMQQLEHVSSAWLEYKAGKQAAEMGFSVGRLDELIESAERADTLANISTSSVFHTAAPRLLTAVATTRAGTPCAFVTFTPMYGSLTGEARAELPSPGLGCPTPTFRGNSSQGWGWALDLMRRVPDAPPGVMELLLVRAIERFRSCRAQVVSLGMVALADTRQEVTPGQRWLASFVADRLHLFESRRTLFRFKQKYHPCWESRYLVTNSWLALPKIALVVLRVRRLVLFLPTFWQFFRYCLVGGANTVIDLFTLNVLLWLFPTNNVLILVMYNSIAYSSGAVSSFFLNKYWTFRHTQKTTWRQVIRFTISLFLEILYSNALIWLAGKALQPLIANPTLWGNASKLLAVVGSLILSYAFMRFWTFASGSQNRPKKEI